MSGSVTNDEVDYEPTTVGAGHQSNLAFARQLFDAFCSYGLPSCSDPTAVPSRENLALDSFRFSKFCRDAKLMKPAGRLGTEDIDLIFMKAKTLNSKTESPDEKALLRQKKRKINFKEFKIVLRLICGKFRCDLSALIDHLRATIPYGPIINGTFADHNVRFYDDKSTYTGVHKNGGPTIIDKEKFGLESRVTRLHDRSANLLVKKGIEAVSQEGVYMQEPNNPNKVFSDSPFSKQKLNYTPEDSPITARRTVYQEAVLQSPKSPIASSKSSYSGGGGSTGKIPSNSEYSLYQLRKGITAMAVDNLSQSNQLKDSSPSEDQLKQLFIDFSVSQDMLPGQNSNGMLTRPKAGISLADVKMDSFRFQKFCRDSNLTTGGMFHLRPQDVDLIFTKAKGHGEANPKAVRKLNYTAFKRALYLMSKHFEIDGDQLVNYILYAASSGPVVNATIPESNRFYDDPSTYTGVHKKGGPTILDDDKFTLQGMVNRAVDKGSTLRAQSFAGSTASSNTTISVSPFTAQAGVASNPESSMSRRVRQSGSSDRFEKFSDKQKFNKQQVNQLQGIHSEQLKEYLHADRVLAVEMATLESEIQASQIFQFHPNIDLEAKKQAYYLLQQRRAMLKEKFQNEHEILLKRSFELQYGHTSVPPKSSVTLSPQHVQGLVTSPGGADDTSVMTMSSVEALKSPNSSKFPTTGAVLNASALDMKVAEASTVSTSVVMGTHVDPDSHVHKHFMDFAGSGSKGLPLDRFLVFCSTTGLLVDPKVFTEADAERIFHSSKKNPSSNTLEYEDFRIVALSKIASKKSISPSQLLYLMSACASISSTAK